jgi:hypothetical protein
VGFGATSVLFGLILLVASIGLFLLDKIKPELHRDSDNIYALLGVICSVFMMAGALNPAHGLDVALIQMMLVGSTISIMWQNVLGRSPNSTAKSGRRNNNAPTRSNSRQEAADNQYRPYRATVDDTQAMEPARGNRTRSLDRDEDFDYPETSRRKRLPQGTSSDSWSENNDWERSEIRESVPQSDRGANRNRRNRTPATTEDRAEPIDRNDNPNNDDLAPRRRRRNSRSPSSSGEGSMSGYVDYEPIENNDGGY